MTSFFSYHKKLFTTVGVIGLFCIFVIVALFRYIQNSKNSSSTIPLASVASGDLTQFVNPFIGTARATTGSNDSGDTFPGAIYPMGLMQWSPDTTTHQPGNYFYPDTQIRGFSLTHFSGRGCDVYENFPFMPYVGTVNASPATNGSTYVSNFSHSNETAAPGYYKVHLDNPNVTTELTVTPRTGFGQFTYPSSKDATMLIGAGDDIISSKQFVTASQITIVGNNQQVTGSATSTVGCGTQQYKIYFAVQFDTSFTSFGTWNGSSVNKNSKSANGTKVGAFVIFDTTNKPVVHARVSISFVSVSNAQANIQSENANSDFAMVKNAASTAWNQKLQSIQIAGGSQDEKTVFYTALYHSFIHPNIMDDSNGQYIGFDNQVHTVPSGHHQYTNIPGWDQYRSYARLLPILFPNETSDILQSLVNDAKQGDGHLPRWVQATVDSLGMNGDSADVYIASGYAFGATNFDTSGALSAMVNGQGKIREGLSDYQKLGYVAASTINDSASVTLEYTNDDYAIAQFAQALGDSTTHDTYVKRSQNWQKLFNSSSGYIQPKDSSGNFTSGFSPTSGRGFREGDSAQYTWMMPFDLSTLFNKMGGANNVLSRLDTHFTELNAGAMSQHAFMGNEPEFEVPWEYDFAGAPYKTQDVIRRIQLQLFSNAPEGLPGNDDGGAMSSWYIFSAIGLYPEIPGVGGFAIGSPLFSQIVITSENGKTIQINGNNAGDASQFIQSLQINGSDYNNPWIPYTSIANGAVLDFNLGPNANTTWGTTINFSPTPIPPVPSATSVVSPTSVQGISPTTTQSGTPPVSPVPQNDTFLSVLAALPGIGIGNNTQPNTKTRTISITVINMDTQTQQPIIQSAVTFNGQYFINPRIHIGNLPSGNYQIFIKLNGTLMKRLKTADGNDTFTVSTSTTLSSAIATLLSGDINGDNILDVQDYNALISCFGQQATSAMCTNRLAADLNDDGTVDGIDYNIFLRSIAATTQGDTPPGS